MVVFSLKRWSSQIHARFLVSDVTQVHLKECTPFHLQDFHLLRSPFPVTLQAVQLKSAFVTPLGRTEAQQDVLQPPISNGCTLTHIGFRLFPVRSPLLGESLLFSFPPGTEMLHFPGLASGAYLFRPQTHRLYRWRYSHSGIHGSTLIRQLPVAYRSLSRPSSPPSAKASTTCPYCICKHSIHFSKTKPTPESLRPVFDGF